VGGTYGKGRWLWEKVGKCLHGEVSAGRDSGGDVPRERRDEKSKSSKEDDKVRGKAAIKSRARISFAVPLTNMGGKKWGKAAEVAIEQADSEENSLGHQTIRSKKTLRENMCDSINQDQEMMGQYGGFHQGQKKRPGPVLGGKIEREKVIF